MLTGLIHTKLGVNDLLSGILVMTGLYSVNLRIMGGSNIALTSLPSVLTSPTAMGLKLGVVAALGAPAVAVLAFEVLLNATSMFNHSNVRMPARLDRALRWIVVTPDMHRVHHSVAARETNSNFGFNLPWWDRLFGTYRDQPAEGEKAEVEIPFSALAEARLILTDDLIRDALKADKEARAAANQNNEDGDEG